ncbi:MAG: hypothetical protein QG622_2958 [Actinomycetota bacterium]|nr:hypothetical protein [Actinomycetota bacterium]
MTESTVTLRFDGGDVRTIQYAVDVVLREIRSRPPLRDARGHAVLDLSNLTGFPPVDLDDVAPGSGLADLDLTRIQVAVRAGSGGSGGSGRSAGSAGTGCGLVVFVGAPALIGSAERARRAEALRAFATHVLLPQLRQWSCAGADAGADAGAPSRVLELPDPAATTPIMLRAVRVSEGRASR